MADFPMAGHRGAPIPNKPVATAANWMGAAVSLALLAGVSVWGYKLLVRDVSGVPVVRAAQGPMRVAPENPGGRPADHQGLSVNEVAGAGTAAEVPDQVVLAPRPTDLSEEDAPSVAIVATPEVEADEPVPATIDEMTASLEPAQTETEAVAAPVTSIQELADQIAAGAVPLSKIEDLDETPEVVTSLSSQDGTSASTPATTPLVSPSVPGVARSPRPRTRPQGLQVASLTQPAVSAQSNSGELDAASVPSGTRLVQLGAYESPEVARTEWTRLAGQFDSFLEGKSRIIQRASSGGRVFYRLRAMGFDDLSDARRFCAALVAENADCIPVVTR